MPVNQFLGCVDFIRTRVTVKCNLKCMTYLRCPAASNFSLYPLGKVPRLFQNEIAIKKIQSLKRRDRNISFGLYLAGVWAVKRAD